MNPDQAADAGVQHDGWSCDGGGDDSWARTLLRRGRDLSRKAALSGAAATAAAPIVAPLLLILSVAGLALSLPFVAYLASLAATDRLMGALLPPPRTPAYQTLDWDLEDDEFLDAQEMVRDKVAAVDNWGETEDGAIREENMRYPSQPLLRHEPRRSEAPATASGDDEDTMAEGESRFQELGHGSFVLDNGEQGTSNNEGYGGYITTEVLPRGFDVSGPMFRDEDNVTEKSVEAPPVPAVESIQRLSLTDSGDETGGGKCTARKEMESSEEMLSLGVDITELSDFQVPALGNQDIVVQRDVEGGNSHVPDIGDNMEEIPLQEIVSESLAPDNITLQRKTEGDVTVEMVVEEATMKTTPVTGEVANEQMGSIATAIPESGSLENSDLVTHELQEASFVDDVFETTTAEDIILDMGDTNVEGVEHHGAGGTGYMEHHAKGGVSSVVPLVNVDVVMDLVSSTRTRSTPVSTLSGDMASVNTRPEDLFNQTTCCPTMDQKLREKEVEEEKRTETEENKTKEKVPTRSMEQQNIYVSKSPVPDDQSEIEDEVTVQMVLEEMTSATDDLVAGKLVAVQLDIVGSESELLPRSDHMAQELQTVNKAEVVEEIEGSTEMEDIIKDISDTNTQGVEHHIGVATCSFISAPSEMTVDGNGLILNRYTPQTRGHDGAMSDKGMRDVDHPHQRTGVAYKLVKEISGRNVVAEITDNYTEQQLREQLDTLSTITGYSSPLSSTLEADLAGLYIFLGVEPPVSSRDASDLNELNAKLWFLKWIIGVE
ncbi:hypothetical protein U9M48_003119 [Paspalum notatum var. saurae]|uniref:Uncharacterized protein n=1 Tax=Paspalum notatum var. saurae TaxID=547442 RepID=A0AAQ3PSR3_PASNO